MKYCKYKINLQNNGISYNSPNFIILSTILQIRVNKPTYYVYVSQYNVQESLKLVWNGKYLLIYFISATRRTVNNFAFIIC